MAVKVTGAFFLFFFPLVFVIVLISLGATGALDPNVVAVGINAVQVSTVRMAVG